MSDSGPLTTLHVCGDYGGSRVHYNLSGKLAQLGVSPIIIAPIRNNRLAEENMPPPRGVRVFHIPYNNRVIRFFPLLKTTHLARRLSETIRNENIRFDPDSTIILSHTLWTDGRPAYLLSKKYNIPFVLTVRNTDINCFLRFLPHYYPVFSRIIARCSCLVFVSEAHRRLFERKWPVLYSKAGSVKSIPNGVDDYWFENKPEETRERPARICFVGKFLAGKNIKGVADALEKVQEKLPDLEAWFVGGTENEFLKVTGREKIPLGTKIKPPIKDKETLAEIYRACRVMVMPSFKETFGLVYIEALSQGCAIIGSAGEGIDGYFSDDAVRVVDPRDIDGLARAIENLVNRYPRGVHPSTSTELVEPFRWSTVAGAYYRALQHGRI